jgi:hypothetical protein
MRILKVLRLRDRKIEGDMAGTGEELVKARQVSRLESIDDNISLHPRYP